MSSVTYIISSQCQLVSTRLSNIHAATARHSTALLSVFHALFCCSWTRHSRRRG